MRGWRAVTWIAWWKRPVRISKLLKKSAPCFIGLGLSVLTAHAQDLPRENPVPGGIAIIPVAPDTEPAPVVHYDNQRVLVTPQAGQWQAVVGLSLSATPGPQILQISDREGQRRECRRARESHRSLS